MKKQRLISALTIAAVVAAGGLAVAQQASNVKSLRGSQVDEYVPLEDNYRQEEKRFVRNYRQQPPLVPHQIDSYQIDLSANQCLACHDWSNAGERGAPTLSMTHYLDRDGNQLDSVAGTRWFCNQCHVPQAEAPALVDNTFNPSN
ncbi:nitrate reductase cytochrome c-type subunit [Shimia sp. W99]|uniref:Periplasmic nitrate reductase, electron transfer subunit n=1 Tax=Shimia aestuarii TaxID=254406 RepID=A0A1I4KCL7_9RHOB|nr:nitrate reductase cytochrome c-type subunit [Shimia aestuarii]SFL76343.1 periplasmic nitrate reductase subunit NapB [Shimia aestuarii]